MNFAEHDTPAKTPEDIGLQDALGQLTPRSSILNALQLIIDAHSLVFVTDRAGLIIYANERLCEVSQYTRDELIGQKRSILRSEYHPESFFEELWARVRSGQVWTGDIQNQAKDGSVFWLQSTVSPIFNEKNQIVGFAGIQTDVTAQCQLMTELQDSEKRAYTTLQSALDGIASAIMIVDPRGMILVSNKAQFEMYPDQLAVKQPGNHISEAIRAQHPSITEVEVQQYTEKLLTSDTSELRQLGDGRKVQIQRTALPGGGYLSLQTDITDIIEKTELLESQAATMDLMKAIAFDVNESADVDSAFAKCLERISKFAGWQIGHAYVLREDGSGSCMPTGSCYCSDEKQFAPFMTMTKSLCFDRGVGLPGRIFASGKPAWIRDVRVDDNFPRADVAKKSGIIGAGAFPIKIRGQVVAVLEFYSTEPIEPSSELEDILIQICHQVARVVERDRSEKILMSRVTAELRKRDRELVEQNERLDAALKNMTQGLCMFDGEQRLIVCNDSYAQMYDLPLELLKPGITLRKIIEHRIANGIYAGANPEEYIQERMDWVSSGIHSNKIQLLSDGRSISITHAPMTDGGWITTHEDITERVLSEKALQESQELFSKAFQLSPVALSISRPMDGTYHAVNDAWTKVLGYNRTEAMENSALQMGIWKNPETRKKFLEGLRTTGSMREFEVKLITKTGQELDALIYGEYVEVDGEELVLMVVHDITKRKLAEAALREGESRFKNLVESTNVVPWEFDPNTMRFTYMGPQAVPLFGYPIEDWYSEGFWEGSIHPDDREKAVRICTEATQQCLDHDFEYRVMTANGSAIWVRDVVSVVVEAGKSKSLRGVIIDISDRKKAIEALEISEQRFKDIVEVSSDWIWECDENLRFIYFSERFTQVTGVPKERILGKTRYEVGMDALGGDWDSHLADLEARRPFRAFSYSVKDENGDTRHWMINGRPMFDENGIFKGYRGTGADRTAEVRDEAELIRHRDHLQDLVNEATASLKERADELRLALAKEKELNELQSQFVSMASHEFRTPLAIIDGAAQRLKRRSGNSTPEDTAKRVEKIRSAVARMTQLMESTLVAAKLETGSPTIRIEACDIGSTLSEICDRQQDIAQNHNISCTVNELPETIQADNAAVEQIFTNLLSNAVKYADNAPEIKVEGHVEEDDVVIRVRDYGVGIDEDDLPNMFQRFFRARTSMGIAGTGIGLNLVKTLVELHNGSITVESKKGEGSMFIVRLPVAGPATTKETEGQAA